MPGPVCDRIISDLERLNRMAGDDLPSLSVSDVARRLEAPPSILPDVGTEVAPFRGISRSDHVWSSGVGRLEIGADGLPSRLASVHGDLVSAPLRFGLSSATAPLMWDGFELIGQSSGGMRWRTFATHAGFRVSLTGTYHFDGLLTIQLESEGAPVDSTLSMTIPLHPELAQHVFAKLQMPLSDVRGEIHSYERIELETERVTVPYSPWLQLADDVHGLILLSTSDEGWAIGERSADVELSSSGASLDLKIGFDVGSGLRRIELALQTLPLRAASVQPHSRRWSLAQAPDAKPLHSRLARAAHTASENAPFPELVIVHQGWTDIQGYAGAKDSRRVDQLREFVSETQGHGAQVLIYLGAELSEASPSWSGHAIRTVALPLRPGRSRGRVRAWRPGAANPAWIEQYLDNLKSLLRRTGADGVFLDMVSDTRASLNPYAGHGYRTPRGVFRAETPWFETRALMLGIAKVVRGSQPHGKVLCHVAGGATPGQSVCDLLFVGEQELAKGRQLGELHYQALLSPHRLRGIYNPHRRGLPVQWLVKPPRGGLSMDRVAPRVFQSDIAIRTQSPHFIARHADKSMLNPVHDQLRFRHLASQRIQDAVWYPWWAAQPVQFHASPDIYISSRVTQDVRAAEIIVSNLGTGSYCTSMEWHGDSIGLPEQSVESARDLVRDEPIGVDAGRLSLCVPPDQFAIVKVALTDPSVQSRRP